MPIRFRVDSLDEIPEEQRSLYRETGDGYSLDLDAELVPVEKIPEHEATQGLRSALQKERERAREEEKRRKALERDFGDLSPEDIEELKALRQKAREQEEENAKARGDFEKLKQSMAEKHRAEIEARESRIEKLLARNRSTTIENQIAEAFHETGVVNPEVFGAFVRNQLATEVDDEGNVEVYVKGSDGQPQYNAEGKRLSVLEYVRTLQQDTDKYGFNFRSRRKAGGGSAEGDRDGAPGGGETLTKEALDAMTPAQRRTAEIKQKIEAYRQRTQG